MTEAAQLPKGWVLTNLGDLIEPSKEKADPTRETNTNYIGLEHIERETGKLLEYGTSEEVRSQKNRFHRGDLLYGKLRPYLNKVYVAEFDGICSTDIIVFPSNSWLSNKFMLYRFLSGDFVKYANQNMSGVQHPRIDFSRISRFQLGLPPISEQNRIASQIEQLFSYLDEGKKSLLKVQAQLKRYRQTVLKYAFEGKLTEKWRKTHNFQIEPAKKLLELVKEERTRKAKTNLYNPSEIEEDNLPKLPDNWLWVKSGILAYFVTSGSRGWKKYYSNLGALFIRTEDINTNKLSLDNIAHVSLPKKTEGKRSLVEKGDILVTITGANVGKVALVNQEIKEAYVSQSVALMKLALPSLGEFIHYALMSESFGKKELSKMVYGMGRPVLSLKNVQEITLPLAPIDEAVKIVEEINRQFSLADQIEKAVLSSIQQSKILRQSILKSANSGSLLNQDPNDEPAEKLLIRIRTNRMTDAKSEVNNQKELSKYVK